MTCPPSISQVICFTIPNYMGTQFSGEVGIYVIQEADRLNGSKGSLSVLKKDSVPTYSLYCISGIFKTRDICRTRSHFVLSNLLLEGCAKKPWHFSRSLMSRYFKGVLVTLGNTQQRYCSQWSNLPFVYWRAHTAENLDLSQSGLPYKWSFTCFCIFFPLCWISGKN